MNRLRKTHRTGFGLIELLVALAISAALLGATALAVHASMMAYQVNQEQATLMSRCRVTLYRMLGQIRCTTLQQPLNSVTNFRAGQTVTDTGITMYSADGGTLYTYSWDADTQELTCKIGSGTPYVLIDGVTAFSIKMQPMKSPDSSTYDLLERATITMTVHTTSADSAAVETTGRQSVTLSSSVMPRRNVWVGQQMPVSIAVDQQVDP